MPSPRFVNVATAPARSGSISVPGLGTFGPLTGPVIGPDGSVYLAMASDILFVFPPPRGTGGSWDGGTNHDIGGPL